MAVSAYTIAFYTLMRMNTGTFRLIKMYCEVPEDSISFQASPISIDADTAEIAAWWLDRQTAIQLYILEIEDR